MPTGNDPPDPDLPAALVTTLKNTSYDSAGMAFKGGSTLYWLFVQRMSGSSDRAQWFYATDSEGAENPKFLIPSQTYTVIKSGTYSSGRMVYQGSTYAIRMYRDQSSGHQVAQAVAV